jgi:hypothetical protein
MSLLLELGYQSSPTSLFSDNQSVSDIIEKPTVCCMSEPAEIHAHDVRM